MKSQRLVIAIHPNSELYGSDRMFAEVVALLKRRASRVLPILAEQGPLVRHLTDLGTPPEVLRFQVLRKTRLKNFRALLILFGMAMDVIRGARQLRLNKPQFLYLSTIIAPQWIFAARLAGVPAICHVHELPDKMRSILARLLTWPLCFSNLVVANSQATAAFLIGLHPSLEHKISVIPNGIPLPSTRARVAKTDGQVRLLLVGRLAPHKGQDAAVEAVRLLLSHGHDVSLTLLGSVFPGYEWYEAQLRDQIERLDLADRVSLVGFHSDPWEFYDASDIVLVPSRMESFGLAAVEALAGKKPVVASAVGGLNEIVINGHTGLSVGPGNVPALVDAISQLIDDPFAAQTMAESGYRLVHERYSLANFERQMVQAFARLDHARPSV